MAAKRSADSDGAAAGRAKHSSDSRAAKRQRKSEPTSKKPIAASEKPTEQRSAKAAKPAQASVLKQEERAFPRGGASVLTPLEHKQIQIQATRDVLFEQSGNKRTPKDIDSDIEDNAEAAPVQSSKRKRRGREDKRPAVAEKVEPRVRVEGLSYKRLVPGSMVVGQITQITSRDISLALPNNLTGFVPVTAVSDQLTGRIEKLLAEAENNEKDDGESDDAEDIELGKMFKIGQYLRAYVNSTEDDVPGRTGGKGKKRIELSIHPRLANSGILRSDIVPNSMVQASVVSVEDHGLIMDLGLEDRSLKGFMSSKEVGHNVDHTKIEEGTVFLCLVTGVTSNGKIVKLSADHQKAGNLKKSNYLTEAPTIDVFLPGAAVEMLVTDVSHSGLIGQIMGMLDATADLIHSGAGHSSKPITDKYKIGSKIKARVVSTFPNADPKKIGVSLLDQVVALSSRLASDAEHAKDPVQALAISSFVEEAKIMKVESGVGLFMDLGVKGIPGFAHISRLSDNKVDTLSSDTGPYKVGSTHRARVIGYNPMDGMYLVSLEQKILDQPFLRIEDIKVGQVVKGKVERLVINARGVGGVLVNLAEGISGLVPEMHMADVHLQHPERKFREGMTVTARVLSTDPEKRQLRLTLKKTLVNTDAEVWSDYSRISPGAQAPGTLVNILRAGAVVQFYGNVRAFLPVSEMSEAYIQDPAQHFRVGQVVNVRVLDVDPAEGKMTVSCKDSTALDASQQDAYRNLAIGGVVNGTVTEKSEDTVTLELEGSGLKAILRIGQLTDGSEKKNASTMKKIRVEQKLQDLVVLEKLERKPLVILSNKPSLLKAARAGKLSTKFEGLREGQELAGFVRNISPEGQVFVQFAGGVVGLLPRSQVTDDMLKLPDYGLRKDQSISVRVLSIDHSQQRFLLTMREAKPVAEHSNASSSNAAAGDAAINPVDGESKSIADYAFGKITKARITTVKETQLNVQLADNLPGRIDVSEVFDDWEDIKDRKQPLRRFKAKQNIPVKVLGIHDARSHRFLPITHRTSKVPVFELTAKSNTSLQSEADILSIDKLRVGSSWVAFVNNIGDNCVWVNISPNIRGRIDFMDLADDVSLVRDVEQNFPIGSALRVRVKNVDVSTNRLDLSATSARSDRPITLQNLTNGMILPGRVTKVTERHVMVQLSDMVSGPVALTELADDYSQANPTIHNKNDIVRVCVMDVDAPNKRITLSMRPSKVLSSSLPVADPQISSVSQLKVNDVVRGFVKNVAEIGLFVSLGPNVTAFVRISDLSDSFIKDWRGAFEVDQLVKGKILAVDPALNHVQMSLKASVIDKDYVPPLTFSDLKVGQVVTGKVRKVEDFGVFIVVDNSANVSGLCHRSEIADEKVEDVKKLYDEGDVVKAIVLKVDQEKHRVNFGLKASYFEDASEGGNSSEDDDDIEGGIEVDMDATSEDDDEMEDGGIDLSNIKSIDKLQDDEESGDAMEVDEAPAKPSAGLTTGGFDWTGSSLAREDAEADHDAASEDEDKPKKKKHRKPEIKIDKTGDLDKYGPQSVADFERQLLGQPNSSSLWIQYMAFQLQLSEVGKAREVAERALRTIDIREEDEKMNVWVALLNLENAYGSDESVEKVFRRACQYNDTREMHERLASIYIDSGKHDKADSLFQTMLRHKPTTASPTFWLNYATFLMTTLASPSRARALLPRATQSVPPGDHRLLTAKFAALEFTSPHGDAERGRTLFEGLLATWPRRWDLWDVYVDLERGRGERGNVRALFERMSGMKMKSRRARFVFKKWLEFEEEEGDGKAVERVKARAAEYVAGLRKGDEEGEGEE